MQGKFFDLRKGIMSYQKLPSYLYMLEKKNPGTMTHLETDQIGHFKYFFMALGVSIRDFKAKMSSGTMC